MACVRRVKGVHKVLSLKRVAREGKYVVKRSRGAEVCGDERRKDTRGGGGGRGGSEGGREGGRERFEGPRFVGSFDGSFGSFDGSFDICATTLTVSVNHNL